MNNPSSISNPVTQSESNPNPIQSTKMSLCRFFWGPPTSALLSLDTGSIIQPNWTIKIQLKLIANYSTEIAAQSIAKYRRQSELIPFRHFRTELQLQRFELQSKFLCSCLCLCLNNSITSNNRIPKLTFTMKNWLIWNCSGAAGPSAAIAASGLRRSTVSEQRRRPERPQLPF